MKLFVTLNSFQRTTLAVLYFSFYVANLHFLKSNIGSFRSNILGKSLVLVHDKIPSFGARLDP